MDNKKVIKTQTELDMEEYLKNNKDTFYKKSSSKVGSRIQESDDIERIAIHAGFTKVKINNFY